MSVHNWQALNIICAHHVDLIPLRFSAFKHFSWQSVLLTIWILFQSFITTWHYQASSAVYKDN